MILADLATTPGRHFPARRWTRNIAGGTSPIQTTQFATGLVLLDPPTATPPIPGGQVPWHNHPQEEVYFLLEGTCEICLGSERQILSAGQSVYIPPNVFHQLTNIGPIPAKMIYTYGPAGDVAHWRQELSGTLPRAGQGTIPPLPTGAQPHCVDPPAPAGASA